MDTPQPDEEDLDVAMDPLDVVEHVLSAENLDFDRSDEGDLAFSLAGLVMQMWTQRDPLQALAPQLAGSGAVDEWVDRLTGYALSMVQGEIARRQAVQQPARRSTSRNSHKESNA